MEKLRAACSFFRAQTTDPAMPSLVRSLIHAPIQQAPSELVDSSATIYVKQFILDIVHGRYESESVSVVINDISAMATDTYESPVAESRLSSSLAFLLSLPERLITDNDEFKFSTILHDASRYLHSLAAAIFLSSSSQLWCSFCKACCRRGLLNTLIQLFQQEERNELMQQRLLELCAALSSTQRRLSQIFLAVATESSATAKWLLDVAIEHNDDSCFRIEDEFGSNFSKSILQSTLFENLLLARQPIDRTLLHHYFFSALSLDASSGCRRCVSHNRVKSLAAVSLLWGTANLHENASEYLESVGHAMSYALHAAIGVDHVFESETLRMILKGISDRFELLLDRNRREEAARVAVLYSRCTGAESDPVFEEFPDSVSKWFSGEPSLRSAPHPSRIAPQCSLLQIHLNGLFPVDPDSAFEMIQLSTFYGAVPSTVQPAPPFAKFGFESLAKPSLALTSVRSIYEQLTRYSSQESEAERLTRTSSALLSTAQVLSQHSGDDSVVAKIFSLLVSVETTATRSEKIAALRACIADSPCSCLAAAHDALTGTALSVVSQVDLWDSIASGAEALSLHGFETKQTAPTEQVHLYPPMRESAARTPELHTKWRSRKLHLIQKLTTNALVPLASSFFTVVLHAPRASSPLQFVDIARLTALTSIVRLLTAATNSLAQWRNVIVAFALSFAESPFPETRALSWEVIATVGKTAQDPSIRLQLRNLISLCNWDTTPLVK
ncbi:Hypothetical protein, putative, partial [Bodo saltans]